MSESEQVDVQSTTNPEPENPKDLQSDVASDAGRRNKERHEARRWWIKLFLQPALLLLCGATLIIALGVAQRLGFITAGSGGGQSTASTTGEAARYICPMMCTPPQSEPGRCPVCAMELVASTSGGGSSDSNSIQLDPAARRVANVHTVAVKSAPMTRTIRAIGELSYDEGTLKTLSAYVDGRLDRLYADYTGVVVKKGDHLALVYSPQLYSGQVELLLAKKAREESRNATLDRVIQSNLNLYKSARERVIELGMTNQQVEKLEQKGEANSRMHLCAPISGTVIEKLAAEGQYVKEGQAIYKLADLSTVWLMLELFPDDAATMRYGQKVEASVQSLPGINFSGRVAFIAPNVNPRTRTVGVRVVIPNPEGILRVGDYAKAIINVPLTGSGETPGEIYDAELANKWISPRHPHIVESSAGPCSVCGVDLVPASQFGFIAQPSPGNEALVVPRDAVLMAGENSVLYVETEPGRFEIRRVVLGPCCGDEIVILNGVKKGEQVATRGNFLIDSQMQLAGNPSLIDPTKAEPARDVTLTEEMIAAFSKLSDDDRRLAENQRICPVTKMPLGSMGTPPKVEVNGRTVFLCCQGCEAQLLDNPEKFLANLTSDVAPDNEEDPAIIAALSELSPADRAIAERQKICPVAEYRLGSMGAPKKVDVNGTPVFICCEGCRESLLAEPDKYLARLAERDPHKDMSDDLLIELPPISAPQIIGPQGSLPELDSPKKISKDSKEDRQATGHSVAPVAERSMEVVR